MKITCVGTTYQVPEMNDYITSHLFFTLIIINLCIVLINSIENPWDLPILPHNFIELTKNHPIYSQSNNEKLIPNNIWISFREVPPKENLTYNYPNIVKMMETAPQWKLHMLGDDDIDGFMNTFYPNTSILHAYYQIHPSIRVANSDIWRYCALYAFGGFYMDDDAFLETPLDNIVQSGDSLILSFEGNPLQNCFKSSYHLSIHSLYNRFKDSYNKKYESIHAIKLNGFNRSMLQWAMFSEARHPLFRKLLENIVEILKFEYYNESVRLKELSGYHLVMCSTGPRVFTTTIREELLKQAQQKVPEQLEYNIRFIPHDFKPYGGIYKWKDLNVYRSNSSRWGEEPRWRTHMPYSILKS